MMLLVLAPCILAVCFGLPAQNESFRGHKVLAVKANEASQVELLRQLRMNDVELDFWSEPSLGGRTDLRVKPKDLKRIEATLEQAGLQWEIINHDVQESVNEEARSMRAVRRSRSSVSYRETYLTFDESRCFHLYRSVQFFDGGGNRNIQRNQRPSIRSTLQNFASLYSDRVKLSTYGSSYEKRDLFQVKVSKSDGKQRPAIWIESLTHAREWVTGSAALYVIEELAKQTSDGARYMLDMFDWYFSPVHNPDGYVYTHTANGRYWRKNRRYISRRCNGVDLNRNWDSYWGVAGVSRNPCADTYLGEAAFSEPETLAFKQAVRNTPNVIAFFSFHAYSQLLLLPYAHGKSIAQNLELLTSMSNKAMEDLRLVHGKNYTVGIPSQILYAASGGAYDYMMEELKIPFSFTYELRPDQKTATDEDYNGFSLPKEEITPTCEEVWASLLSYTQQIAVYTQKK